MRYALDIPRGEKAQDTKYKDELIRHTWQRRQGDVDGLRRIRTGIHHLRIFREARTSTDGKLQPGVSIRETVLRRPIYFGQKDLSSTGEGFETDLVEKLVGEKLRTLRDEIETQRQHVRDAASRWLKLSNTEELRRDHESQLTDANFRLKKFEEYGVADKLQKRLGFQQDATALTRMKDRADSFVIALGQLISEHEDDLRNAMSYVSKQNPGFFTAYYAEFANLVAKVDQLKKIEQEARAITARLQAKQGEFDGARQSLQEEFAQSNVNWLRNSSRPA